MLGCFMVSVGTRTIREGEWRLKKARSLIKLLALAPGHRLHREQAMEWLWPDLDSGAAANNLHHALHVARRVLEPAVSGSAASHYLHLRDEQLVLCPEGPLWVDVKAFEVAAATSWHTREPSAYRAAVELYAGELLPQDRYEPWTEERREELRQLHLALLSELAALYEERGEHEPAIEALRRVLAEEPAKEEAHIGLMRLYAIHSQHREAILQYGRLQQALREKLDEEPGEASRRLYEEIRTGKLPAAPPLSAGRPSEEPASSSPNNLPTSMTSFVGREREMLEIKRLLSMTRLLTLTGAGGSGKRRLALEVARNLLGACWDAVWLVELAPLSNPLLAAQAVAQALGVREQPGRAFEDTLKDYLSTKNLLLVLDNCEHLLDSVAHLTEKLLSACPKLRILATSREPLAVRGEVVWMVPPLSLPGADGGSIIEGLIRYEAIGLFVDRARARLPGFELTEENAGAAVRVCRRLEGIPLAIELATARMGALPVKQVAERLEVSLKLLSTGARTTEPRHRTMRAALEWSYELLNELEKKLFGRLSVFAGSTTLEAAEEVCSGEGIEQDDVLDLLFRLVEKSLVVVDAGRYRMLEPIKQYAREKLEEAAKMAALPSPEQVRERHARYYLRLAQRVEPELMGAEPAPWLAALEREVGNLQAALAWTLDGGSSSERVEMGLRLANALARFWDTHSPGEGRRWFEKGLSRGVQLPPQVRAEALREAGFMAAYEWDPRSIEMLAEAFELYKELGDQADMLLAVEHLGHALAHHATPEVAAPILAEVETLLKDSGDPNIEAHYVNFLGFAAEVEGNHEETRLRWKEALAIYRDLGDHRNIARCLPSLGIITLSQHDVEEAARYFEEGLGMVRDIRYKTMIFFHLMGLAAVATHRGQARRAAKLFGASEVLQETGGFSFATLASGGYDYEGYLDLVRTGLDRETFETAWSEGRALSTEDAIGYALGSEVNSAASGARERAENLDPLSRREREVAILVGQGFTNRRIAEELGINERTVETHVGKMLRKLGLRSRTQIAIWTTRPGLGGAENRES